MSSLSLILLEGNFAICRLAPNADVPSWVGDGPFVSITRTSDELSIVCGQESVPDDVRCDRVWRCLRVAGTLDLSLVGVLASLLNPLAKAGLCVFALSTFDTDFLLIKEQELPTAIKLLREAGHSLR